MILGVACFCADILTMTIRLGVGSSCHDVALIYSWRLDRSRIKIIDHGPLTSRMHKISFKLVLQFMRWAHGRNEAHFNADVLHSDST